MADVWAFGSARDSDTVYADGTTVPHQSWSVTFNGVVVGEAEVHMHKRRGPDGKTDVSFGFTGIVYGPPPRGK